MCIRDSQFLRRNAVAGRCEQIDRIEPKLQRSARLFKRRSDGGVQVVAAPLTGRGPLSFVPEPLGSALTLGALEAFVKANVKQMLQAGFVVRELAKELGGSEGLRCYNPLYATFSCVWQGDTPPNYKKPKM